MAIVSLFQKTLNFLHWVTIDWFKLLAGKPHSDNIVGDVSQIQIVPVPLKSLFAPRHNGLYRICNFRLNAIGLMFLPHLICHFREWRCVQSGCYWRTTPTVFKGVFVIARYGLSNVLYLCLLLWCHTIPIIYHRIIQFESMYPWSPI
jgi:hypothetical protein